MCLFGKEIYKFKTFRGFEYSVLVEGSLRENQRLKTQKEKWGLKKGGRPIRNAETEKEWEAKVVWEVSKERPKSGGWKSLMEIKMCGRQKRW